MSTLQKINPINENKLAPSVYIKSISLETIKDTIYATVNYSLNDKIDASGKRQWSDNEEMLSKYLLDISAGDSTHSVPLYSIKNDENALEFNKSVSIKLGNDQSGSYNITAGSKYVDTILGEYTNEQILVSGTTAESPSDQYITKIKDYRLLEVLSAGVEAVVPYTGSQLYVSYTTDKRAHAGFMYNLDYFLTSKSKAYNIIKNNKDFFDYVKVNSKIDIKNTKFYIKNINSAEKDYSPLGTEVQAYRISESENVFFIATTDNKHSSTNNIFEVACNVAVFDASREFIDANIVGRVDYIKSVISAYQALLDSKIKNKNLQNPIKDFFENDYSKEYAYIDRKTKTAVSLKLEEIIVKIAQELADISVVFYDKPKYIADIPAYKKELTKLFLSCLHPLLLDNNSVNKTLQKITEIKSMALRYSVSDKSESGGYSGNNPSNTSDYLKFSEYLDFNYDKFVGYEIIDTDSINVRVSSQDFGFKKVTQQEIDARNIYEARKYFGAPKQQTISNNDFFSISQIDLARSLSFDLSLVDNQKDLTTMNLLYVKINEYNDYKFRYPKTESVFSQFAESGICIKNVATRQNGSQNKLFQNTLFDNSEKSKDSAKYIAGTGINDLYILTDKNEFDARLLNNNSMQLRAAQGIDSSESPNFPTSSATTPASKVKLIFNYNTIGQITPVDSIQGNLYILYSIDTSNVHTIFNKKMRLFNRYFLQKYGEERQVGTLPELTLTTNYNLESKHLNRNTTEPTVLVGADSI